MPQDPSNICTLVALEAQNVVFDFITNNEKLFLANIISQFLEGVIGLVIGCFILFRVIKIAPYTLAIIMLSL